MSPNLKKFILNFLKEECYRSEPLDFQQLPGDGSKRIFWRISFANCEQDLIAMANPPMDSFTRRENLAYLMIGRHLSKRQIPVPEIFRYNLEQGWFIMKDLGRSNLQDFVNTGKNILPVYEKVVAHLFRLQTDGAREFDASWCCQTKRYDHTVMRRYESNYFKEAFLYHYLGLKKEWPELEPPFDHLAEMASKANSNFFLHRDFQSRNILVSNSHIGFIDWQGGRFGPLGYDLASLLIDPYTALSVQLRSRLFQRYISLVKDHEAGCVEPFKRTFPYLAIQRNLQILGAFAYLTKIKNKTYFQTYIPSALETLKELLDQLGDPKLSQINYILNDLQPVDI